MSYAALSLNNTFSVHRDLLLENYIKGQNNKASNPDALMALSYVIERLKHDELVRPITILGITINNNFILRLFLVIITGIFGIFQLSMH